MPPVRGGPRHTLGALVALCWACEEGPLFIPLPDAVQQDSTLILTTELATGPRVLAVPASEALFVTPLPGRPLALSEFEASRGPLPFELGELRSAEPGCPLLEEFAPDRSFVAALHEAGLSSVGWTPAAAEQLPAALRELRVPSKGACRSDRCPSWEATPFEFPASTGTALWGVDLGDGRALFGTANDRVYVVDARGEAEPVTQRPRTLALRSGLRDPEGRLWFGAHLGVVRGELGDGHLDLEPIGSEIDDVYAHITVPTSSTGEGMFALTDRGRFLRFRGRDWESIPLTLSPIQMGRSRYGGLAHVGPEDLVVAPMSDIAIWRHRSGELQDVTPTGLAQLVGAIEHVPGWGTILATVPDGLVYDDHDGVWTRHEAQLFAGIRDIIPFEDGVLFGGETGLVRQYIFGQDFCPSFRPFSATIRAMVEVEPGVVIVAGALVDGVKALGAVMRRSDPRRSED